MLSHTLSLARAKKKTRFSWEGWNLRDRARSRICRRTSISCSGKLSKIHLSFCSQPDPFYYARALNGDNCDEREMKKSESRISFRVQLLSHHIPSSRIYGQTFERTGGRLNSQRPIFIMAHVRARTCANATISRTGILV